MSGFWGFMGLGSRGLASSARMVFQYLFDKDSFWGRVGAMAIPADFFLYTQKLWDMCETAKAFATRVLYPNLFGV